MAVRCSRVKSVATPAAKIRRTRDPDLSRSERIELRLDSDRDLRSGFVFTIDHLGRAAESCCGASGWNPEWYVASAQTEDAWCIECAIPLKELNLEEVEEQTIAAIAISRLDANSVNLWSDSERSAGTRLGLLAGFKLQAEQYEFVRLAVADTGTESTEK